MRLDESGNQCPATLGEYRDLCAAIGTEDCRAVKFIDRKIAEAPENGRDELVLASDHQMRMLLMPLLLPEDAT